LENQDNYDFLRILREGDIDRLRLIEDRLIEARTILNIPNDKFVRAFGFTNDLLTRDSEKIHDVLAEPLLVVDLTSLGFTAIEKLPPSISTPTHTLPNADFVASFGERRYAIELKTIRMENKPKPELGKFLGDGTKRYWWGEMFRNNATMKIEDKQRRVLRQLANARTHYKCVKTMLVLYTRRLGPSTLMSKDDYFEELTQLHQRYSDVDHFACKDYFGAVVVFPALS
jgi:hypothetical protein